MPSMPPSRARRAAVAKPATRSSISAWVKARGSAWKREVGTAEGAIAGGSGGSAICSRPLCRSWTKSRAPWPRTAAPRRSYAPTIPGR